MANKRITELNLHTSPELSDVLPIVNSSETKKVSYGTLKTKIQEGLISGSSQITIGDTTGFTEFSSSLSASIAEGTNEQDLSNLALISGGNDFIGTQTISGDIDVSGNSRFGITENDTHQFTGSLLVSGSINTNRITGRTILSTADLGDQSPTVRINENFEVNHAEILVNREVTGTGTSFIRVQSANENFEFGRRVSKNPNVDMVALAISPSGSISLARPDFDPWRSGSNVVQIGENSALVEIKSIFDGELTIALPYNGYINTDGYVTHRKDGPIALMAIGDTGNIYFRTTPSGSAGDIASRVDTNMTILHGNGVHISSSLTVGDGIEATGSVDISGSLTASLQENYVWLGSSNNTSTQVSLDTLAASGSLIKKAYGSFYDTTTQSGSADTAYAIKHNSVDFNNGVTIVSGSQITLTEDGTYTIISTQQFVETSGGTATITGWLRKNGVDIPNSGTDLRLKGNGDKDLYAINYFVEAQAGDYYQLMWSTDDGNVHIAYTGPRTSPTRPAVPSVITTINRVG